MKRIVFTLLAAAIMAGTFSTLAQAQRPARNPRQAIAPAVGDRAPDFTLKTNNGEREVQLSSFMGQRPVVLVFGSFT